MTKHRLTETIELLGDLAQELSAGCLSFLVNHQDREKSTTFCGTPVTCLLTPTCGVSSAVTVSRWHLNHFDSPTCFGALELGTVTQID